jgi:hypothetical protein
MALKSAKWVKLFDAFVSDIRITSKEAVSQDERGTPLEMWESQRRFIKEVGTGLDNGIHKFYCLKSRQLGVTTVSLAIDVFWLALHPNLIGCLVTDTEKNREANRQLLQKYVESFPDGYFGDTFKIVKNNRQMLLFSNGSRLDLLVAGVKDKGTSWGEGVGYAFGHLTEVASYGSAEGLKSLEEGFAQTNPNRLFIYESTAKGFNHWRSRYIDGLNDPLSARAFFVGWWAGDTNVIPRKDPRFLQHGLHPPDSEEQEIIDYVRQNYHHKITAEQLAWIRWKTESAGAEAALLDQNQPWTAEQAFVQTGYSFFQTRVITQDLKKLEEESIRYRAYRYEVDGDFFNFKMYELKPGVDSADDIELKVWEEPVDGAKYVIGMDPAYGRNDHKDHHVISVWRCFADKVVQVAEYCTADVEAKHAAWVLFHLSSAYKDCLVNPEVGGPGAIVLGEFDHLRQLLNTEANASKTQARGWEDAGAHARMYLYKRPDSMGAGYVIGFATTWSTQSVLMHQLRGSYVSNELDIKSRSLLQEMALVVVEDGHIGAPESRDENCKDDRVFAMAFAVRAWRDWTRKEMMAQGQTYEAVMRIESGTEKPIVTSVNRIVYNYLRTMDEQSQEEPETIEPWREEYGL